LIRCEQEDAAYSLWTWKGRVKLDPAIRGTLYFAAVVLASWEEGGVSEEARYIKFNPFSFWAELA
jgi:hypothetical protein